MNKLKSFSLIKKIQLKYKILHFLSRIGLKNVLLNKYFNNFKIKKIVDIGANIGQFATQIYSLGYKYEIYSFEPLKKEYSLLKKNTKGKTNWNCYNLGIGEKKEKKKIFISQNSVSSSFMKVNNKHLSAAPESVQSSYQIIDVITLDEAFKNKIKVNANEPIFLKIDVQGYEINILEGFPFGKYNIPLLLVEASFTGLYDGQGDFNQLINLLYKNNYSIIEIILNNKFRAKNKLNSLLQSDFILCRNDYLNKFN